MKGKSPMSLLEKKGAGEREESNIKKSNSNKTNLICWNQCKSK